MLKIHIKQNIKTLLTKQKHPTQKQFNNLDTTPSNKQQNTTYQQENNT